MTSKDIITTPRLGLIYEPGARCPSCGGRSWHVGRVSADCGKCGYPLPLPASQTGGGTFTASKAEPGWKGVTRA